MSGKDFRRNMETAWELDGQYATDVFTNVSVDIIKSHNKSTPLFLYVAHAAVHAGNVGKPLEAEQQTVDRFSYISDPNRRTYAGKLEHFGNRLLTLLSSVRRHDVVPVVCICTSNVKIIFLYGYDFTLRMSYSRVLLERLAGSQLVKKFPACYGTRRFVTRFTRACHLSPIISRISHLYTKSYDKLI